MSGHYIEMPIGLAAEHLSEPLRVARSVNIARFYEQITEIKVVLFFHRGVRCFWFD